MEQRKLSIQEFISYGGLENLSIHCNGNKKNGKIKLLYKYDIVGKELQGKFEGNKLLGLERKRYTNIGIRKALDRLRFESGHKQYNEGESIIHNGEIYTIKRNCNCHLHCDKGVIQKYNILIPTV